MENKQIVLMDDNNSITIPDSVEDTPDAEAGISLPETNTNLK